MEELRFKLKSDVELELAMYLHCLCVCAYVTLCVKSFISMNTEK